MAGDDDDGGDELPSVDHAPLNEGGMGKNVSKKKNSGHNLAIVGEPSLPPLAPKCSQNGILAVVMNII